MNLLVLLLLSPAVICAQRLRKSTNPNDEPFLPIHPDYPYSPKLMKRGLEHQQQHQQQPHQLLQQQIQPQTLGQLTPELYAPKVDTSSGYAQSPYYSNYDSLSKLAAAASSTPNALTNSPFLANPAYSSLNANPYSLLGAYGSPYGSAAANYAAAGLGGAPGFAASQYAGAGASPYAGAAGYPNYYYQPPYYYPNYYGQPPYGLPPPLGYPGGPSKHPYDDDDDYDEDEKRREKNSKKNHKNRLRNSDKDNQYVDGANYIISSAKDLDGESSTHRTPAHYNQIEDSDVQPRAANLPKATYRLIGVSNQPSDYNGAPLGYIKVQQLEQLMRQALTRLLAQNAAQQANLAQIQQEATQQLIPKDNQQYSSLPGIAKTGLSYVVNPTILNRVNAGPYNPSQLIQPQSSKPYAQKTSTSVTLQHSPGIYIPPIKTATDQSAPPEYGDYDSPDSATNRSPPTVEPTRYPYSTYRPTQQTNLEDVNFGTKQKTKS